MNEVKNKNLGQVFTPLWIVKKILNESGFISKNKIYNKKILEPSFGDGIFLQEIIIRIIKSGKKYKISNEEIANNINNNIFGYEIDPYFYDLAIKNITKILIKIIYQR